MGFDLVQKDKDHHAERYHEFTADPHLREHIHETGIDPDLLDQYGIDQHMLDMYGIDSQKASELAKKFGVSPHSVGDEHSDKPINLDPMHADGGLGELH
jgi:hypothetical protein